MSDTLFLIGPDARGVLDPELAGGKAAALSRMAALGLSVPPAFVLSTELCAGICAGDPGAEERLAEGLRDGLAYLERLTGRRFGDPRRPLLVSVRSGAAKSMPGMLDTVLDVGLNAETVRGLIRMTGNPRLAWDCCRRFVQGFAEVVRGAPRAPFDQALAKLIESEGAASLDEIDGEALERLTASFLDLAASFSETELPDQVTDQLSDAAHAVYRSWLAPRACEYRRLNALDDLAGTAVTVQAMVYGNAGGRSGSGVMFTRNPATGANELYLDFLFNAQGEDVVSGRRVPGGLDLLRSRLPQAADELVAAAATLERAFADVQDVEFTIEDGRLYLLQTRDGKRAPRAALKIAADLVAEKAITPAQALARLKDIDLETITAARFKGEAPAQAHAIPASAGVTAGRAAFDAARAVALAESGDPVILVRQDPATDDVAGFAVASGILTAAGGRTAHAAVVARQLGKVCLVGCAALAIEADGRGARLGNDVVREGDWLSLDGDAGAVYLGRREIVAEAPPELALVKRWRKEAASAAA